MLVSRSGFSSLRTRVSRESAEIRGEQLEALSQVIGRLVSIPTAWIPVLAYRALIPEVARAQHLEPLKLYVPELADATSPVRCGVLIGTAKEKASVLSLTLAGYSNNDVGVALNREGIAVRTGHHCAQPILRRFGLESTVRPTLALYNTCEDVDRLVAALHRIARGQSEISSR